jgi:hypothetical protein
MRRGIIVACLAVGVIAWIFLVQRGRNRGEVEAKARLEQELERKRADLEAEQNRTGALESQLNQTRIDAAENERKARALAAALATNRPSASNAVAASTGNPLQDPAMRRMLLKQQVQNLNRNIKRLVNPEMQSKLKLDSDQAAMLRALLRRKGGPAIDLLMGVMSGELDPEQAGAMGQHVKEERAAADAEIKKLLGAEGYEYFDSYERSDPERERVCGFRSQFADEGHPLTAEQEQQLASAMFEERQKFKFTIDYNDPMALDFTRTQEFFNEENMNRFFVEMEQLNEQTLSRVQPLLGPEQFAEFERLQQEHLERGRETVRMTQGLFPMKKVAQTP